MNVFIRRYQNDYEWFASSAESGMSEAFHGSLQELGDYYRASFPSVANWVLVAPALDLAVKKVEFSAKERKHINKALPYILEEHLLTEADELHYVTDRPAVSHVNVVAMDRNLLQGWLDELAGAGIKPTHCIPESKLLLDTTADWQIFFRRNEFIIQTADGHAAAFAAEHFGLSVMLLTDGYSKLPGSIELVTEDEQAAAAALQFIPDAIKHLLTGKTASYPAMLSARFPVQSKLWNLLRGRFAQGQQWLGALHPWRWVLASLLLVFGLHVIITFVDYQRQKSLNKSIKAQMELVFRQVTPRGQVVDYRKQLEQELARLNRGGSGGSFVALINKTGSILARYQVVSLSSMSYNRDKAEMKLDMLVDNYEKLDGILADIKAAGLSVEIQDSTAQENKLQARIRITGQP